MLVPREEVRFDAGGARFDIERDRDALAWIFSQALFGEATGCYCGAALYTAPDIESATFLSRQAVEEFAHFRNFLRIFRHLGLRPSPPSRVLRFLTSHEKLWDQHVFVEMALGEGLVLVAFDALIETIDHDGIRPILESIAEQECGHVRFGEQQTLKVLKERPGLKPQMLGRALVTIAAIRLLGRHVHRLTPPDHPVLSLTDRLLDHAIRVTELRLQRLGILEGALAEIGRLKRWRLMTWGLAASRLRGVFTSGRPRIPRTYLDDAVVREILDADTARPRG